MTNILFTMWSNSFKMTPLIINTTSQKNTKKRGIDNIFNIGLIVALIIHRIIPHNIYVFNHPTTIIPAVIHFAEFSQSK
jgi:hypothetical protein